MAKLIGLGDVIQQVQPLVLNQPGDGLPREQAQARTSQQCRDLLQHHFGIPVFRKLTAYPL